MVKKDLSHKKTPKRNRTETLSTWLLPAFEPVCPVNPALPCVSVQVKGQIVDSGLLHVMICT